MINSTFEIDKLYNESNIETLKRVPDCFINLTITSPQYNVDLGVGNNQGHRYDSSVDNKSEKIYFEELHQTFSLLYKKTAVGGRCVINIGNKLNGRDPVIVKIITMMCQIGWLNYTCILWLKNQVSARTAWGSWLSPSAPSFPTPFEFILVFCKEVYKLPHKGETDLCKEEFIKFSLAVWEFPGVSKKVTLHPAAFPAELPYRCIKMFSYIGDVIYDPYAGVGTTLLVGRSLDRRVFGSEISTNYCKVFEERFVEDFYKIKNNVKR